MKKPLFLLLCALLLVLAGATPALAGGQTFVVQPSGGDDTANIQSAFDQAIAAGPGSTVRLTSGHFYMNNILLDGFLGRFMGAGMQKTVIDTLRGLNPALPGVTMMADPDDPAVDLAGFTFLIGFVRSDVRVADMTFDITAAEPCVEWGEGEYGGQTNLSDVFVVARDSGSAFDRVRIRAHEGDVNGLNIEGALAIFDTGGSHSITRCRFKSNSGPEIGYLLRTRLTIGGSSAMGNRFDVYGFGGYFTDISDSRVDISHNRVVAATGAGFYVQQLSDAPSSAPSRFTICDNRIAAMKDIGPDGSVWGAAGVILEDDPWSEDAPVRMDAVVADNRIVLDNGGRAGGIDGFGADGVRVMHNTISGTGIAGVDAGTDIYADFGYPTAPALGWRIIGNDLSGLDCVNDYGGAAAPIWLGTASSHCLVVGGRTPTDVLDQGTDNVLVNVNRLTMSSPAGPARSMHAFGKSLKPVKQL